MKNSASIENILQDLIAGGSPYSIQFHRVLAKKYVTSVTKVGAIAQRFSLAIDEALKREKYAATNKLPKIPGRPIWKQAEARAILAQSKAEKQAIKEHEDMIRALETCQKVTPELLRRVGTGSEFNL